MIVRTTFNRIQSYARSAGYDWDKKIMEIEFWDGKIYRYHNVESWRWQELFSPYGKAKDHFDICFGDKYWKKLFRRQRIDNDGNVIK